MRTFKCGFMQVYGLTETTGAITALPPEDHDPEGPRKHLLRSAGKPIAGSSCAWWTRRRARLRRRRGRRSVDPHRAEHEGLLGEPERDRGRFRRPRRRRHGLVPLRGRRLPARGYVYMHDRIKDMIVSGGENIYPAEVENALMQHPAVADVAVIGVPDEQWGEAVKACVVLKPGASRDRGEIIAFMRGRIAHFKCPRSVDFMEAIPRNPTGKILKRVLREPYWRGRQRRVN